jgi:ubiquinone/menaquinone biosynthesis C-methylase UbiE
MGRWGRIVAEAFLDWLNAPKNLRWLDVGCGNGAFTEELIARCAPQQSQPLIHPMISSRMRGNGPG